MCRHQLLIQRRGIETSNTAASSREQKILKNEITWHSKYGSIVDRPGVDLKWQCSRCGQEHDINFHASIQQKCGNCGQDAFDLRVDLVRQQHKQAKAALFSMSIV